jgi:HK97 family phage major capsid protein
VRREPGSNPPDRNQKGILMDLIRKLIERRKALKTELETMNTTEEGDIRALTAEDDELFKAKAAEVRQLDERIEELRDAEVREAAAAKFAVPLGTVAVGDGVVHEPNPVYRRGDNSTSFFKDLAAFQLNTNIGTLTLSEARTRLAASQETRAGDMTTVAGAGGEMAPPLWQVEDFVALARAGRVTADLCQNEVLPSGVSSINLPKVASGVTVAVQATQNSALSDTAMTTTSVSSGITTVGGKQIVSMQLLQQSGIPFDKVILQDLAKAYAVQVDTQVLYGTNANGQLRGLVGVAANSAFTSATPAVASVTNANSLYYTLTKAAAAVQAGIFEPANAIVMHPNRWAWILGAVDSSARPFVIPQGGNFNPVGTTGDQVAQGAAGYFGSYPVYTDPNISTTANSATNQDEIYILRTDQLWLYESPVQSASFDATYADNASILFRILGYLAFIPHRYTAAVQSVRGTGLIAP